MWAREVPNGYLFHAVSHPVVSFVIMFDSMIQQTRAVVTSGLSRVELEDLVGGAGRVMAAMGALQVRCAVEIEALNAGGDAGNDPGVVGVRGVARVRVCEVLCCGLFHVVSYTVVRLGSCSIR